jgi:hypothetical protein
MHGAARAFGCAATSSFRAVIMREQADRFKACLSSFARQTWGRAGPSTLGLTGRRLGYTQLALEHPDILSGLFTAADLTLAALLRPAMLVPFFRDHPRLQGLLQWRLQQLHEHKRETHVSYEKALDAVRRRRGWALGRVKWLTGPSQAGVPAEIPSISVARNDQQSMGRWPLLKSPYWYLRLAATCGLGRTAYT